MSMLAIHTSSVYMYALHVVKG